MQLLLLGVRKMDVEEETVCASIDVEVALHPRSVVALAEARRHVQAFLEERAVGNGEGVNCVVPGQFEGSSLSDTFLNENVVYIRVCDVGPVSKSVIHLFHLSREEPEEEVAGEENEEVVMCTQWTLPNEQFDGLWDSLHYDEGMKEGLLKYVRSAVLFSDLGVDQNIISCNRVVLLHGPPGTGKTSLSQALAQKVAIRFSDRFSQVVLVEVNAHSLFSKWFSESGKLVMKLFESIREQLEVSGSFVCVLIDEVESLTAARTTSMAGSEPSDAIRVVNALLTQLDQLRRFHNTLILTTSNITGAIDVAFVDRADIKQYIGHPGLHARYDILASCCNELTGRGIIYPAVRFLQYTTIAACSDLSGEGEYESSIALFEISKLCEGVSGRALRKFPFLAHARYITVPSCSVGTFLTALRMVIMEENESRSKLA